MELRLICLLAAAAAACANPIAFVTPPGSVNSLDGQPVAAQATFLALPGSLIVTLNNLQTDPRSVSQSLNALTFSSSAFLLGPASLTASWAPAVAIARSGAFRELGILPTGWELESGASWLRLCVLCADAGPAQTLLGYPPAAGLYLDAGGSVAGNGPHNPFLEGWAMFEIAAPGLSPGGPVDSVTFSFGTKANVNIPGDSSSAVPEPASMLLMGGGLSALCWLLYGRHHSRRVGSG